MNANNVKIVSSIINAVIVKNVKIVVTVMIVQGV